MIRISNIGTMTWNNWILETQNGIIAVDTGMPGKSDLFLKRFRKNRQIDDLKFLFLTHAHIDHAGFVSELMEKTGTRLVLCEETRKILAIGQNTGPHEYKNWLGVILEKTMQSNQGKYPVVTDASRMDIIKDDDPFFADIGIPARVVFLPGHSPDSIGLHLYENKIIICGDAAMNRPLLNSNRTTCIIEDVDSFNKSWDRILQLGVEIIYPGHGKPFNSKDLVKYKNYIL